MAATETGIPELYTFPTATQFDADPHDTEAGTKEAGVAAACHVCPPSALNIAASAPSLPTATHVDGATHDTAFTSCLEEIPGGDPMLGTFALLFQVCPPLVVLRATVVPLAPTATAMHVVEVRHERPDRPLTPETVFGGPQVMPPSVLISDEKGVVNPVATRQSELVAHDTAMSPLPNSMTFVELCQVTPPSLVTMVLPVSSMATQCDVVGQDRVITAAKFGFWNTVMVSASHVEPPSVVFAMKPIPPAKHTVAVGHEIE
jgi:hypothetical protein